MTLSSTFSTRICLSDFKFHPNKGIILYEIWPISETKELQSKIKHTKANSTFKERTTNKMRNSLTLLDGSSENQPSLGLMNTPIIFLQKITFPPRKRGIIKLISNYSTDNI